MPVCLVRRRRRRHNDDESFDDVYLLYICACHAVTVRAPFYASLQFKESVESACQFKGKTEAMSLTQGSIIRENEYVCK